MDENPRNSPSERCDGTPPTLDYAPAGGGANRAIASFPDSSEAHMVAIVLEGQGIRASVGEARAALDFGRRPGTLLVREADVSLAVELLASTPARKWLTVPDAEVPPARVLKLETCPKCESPEIHRRSLLLRILPVVLGLLWVPVLLNYGIAIYAGLVAGWMALVLQTPAHRCKCCGCRWGAQRSERIKADLPEGHDAMRGNPSDVASTDSKRSL